MAVNNVVLLQIQLTFKFEEQHHVAQIKKAHQDTSGRVYQFK